MYSETMIVSPELAREFLATSKINPRFGDSRRFNKTVVTKYAADMKAGRWALTHQGIAFNENKELIDGHNRLNAIILSGVGLVLFFALIRALSRVGAIILRSHEYPSSRQAGQSRI